MHSHADVEENVCSDVMYYLIVHDYSLYIKGSVQEDRTSQYVYQYVG